MFRFKLAEFNGKCNRYDKIFVKKVWFDVFFKNFKPKIHIVNCVYLIKIGTVSDFRIPYNIDNSYKNHPIYKWGRTTNLKERYKRHQFNYKKISNVDIELTHYCVLNPINVVNVESIVAKFFKSKNYKLNHDKYQELAIILDEDLHKVISFYDSIQNNKIEEVSGYINKNRQSNCVMQISKNIQNYLNILSPSIYLFKIGTVKNLRQSMNMDYFYDNTDIVVHWGVCYDLLIITSQYNEKESYGGIPGSNVNLLVSAHIDLKNILAAENSITEYFMENNYNLDSDLAIIPKKQLDVIKKQYNIIANTYDSNIRELDAQIKLLKSDCENRILSEKNRADLAEKDVTLLKLKLNSYT